MKQKYWGIIAAIGFGEMLLSNALVLLGSPWRPIQFLGLGGAAVFLFGLLGVVIHSARHPAWVCPHCGKGIGGSRGLRTPRGGPLARGRETFICPHCGVMLHSYDLKKAE